MSEPQEHPVWNWNENITFDVDVKDIPRGARLCLSIWAVYGSNKKVRKRGRDVSVLLTRLLILSHL